MNDYSKPVYSVDGKEFRTVNGLCKYLMNKHSHASEVGGVTRDRKIHVRGATSTSTRSIIAVYSVSAPEIGKPMVLTQESI
jgi:hypothetical protein